MTYLGQDNDFVKSSYSFTLSEAYFKELLGALPACNAFFEFLCGLFASQKFYKFTCCLRGSFLNCPTFTEICPFLFTLYVLAIVLIFDQ